MLSKGLERIVDALRGFLAHCVSFRGLNFDRMICVQIQGGFGGDKAQKEMNICPRYGIAGLALLALAVTLLARAGSLWLALCRLCCVLALAVLALCSACLARLAIYRR